MKGRLFWALAIGAAALLYLKLGRPRVLNWNATAEEAARSLPGDELLPEAALQTTRAISIDAPPSAVWPWIVQMGPRPRAGVYTYDWLQRLLGIDIENADRIMPEHQHLEPGEFFSLGKQGNGLRVKAVEPQRALVLQWEPARATWTFALYPQDGGTRLISRNRIPGSGPLFWMAMAVMEPASLVMERKMLLGIKARAERPPAGGEE